MKNIITLCVLIQLTSSSFSQPPYLNSFQKFSYLLITMNNGDTIGNATGFFVRRCNHLYLVSNFHVFANRNIDLSPIKHKNKIVLWNKLLIRYKKKQSTKWSYYSFSLEHAQTFASNYKKQFPMDIFYEEITGIDPNNINIIDLSANPLLDKNIKNGSDAFFWGYPGEDFKSVRNPDNRSSKLTFGSLVDYYNEIIPNSHNMTFKISSKSGQGNSGSPVFASYFIKKKQFIKFLGIHFGTGGQDSSTAQSVQFRYDAISMLLPPCPK